MRAELADGMILEFPDGTDPKVIQATVKKVLAQSQKPKLGEPGGLMASIPPIGGEQALGAIASGIAAEPVAGLAGIAQSLNPFAEEGAGAKAVEDVRNALTFTPDNPQGLNKLEQISDVLQPVADLQNRAEQITGDVGYKLGGPVAGAIGATVPAAIETAIGGRAIAKGAKTVKNLKSRIISGETSKDLAPYRISKTGAIEKDPHIRPLKVKGFNDGTLQMAKASSPVDKGQMLKMVAYKKRAMQDPRWGAENRPSDIVGGSLTKRIEYVKNVNKRAGALVNKEAKSLRGKQVEFAEPINKFKQDLSDLDIKFDNNTLELNFDDSVLFKLPKAQKVLTDAVDFLKRGKPGQAPDAYRLHQAKKYIDNVVDYGKADGGATGDVKNVLKNLRHNINKSLQSQFSNYKKANTTYSETIDAINGLQDIAGKRIDLFGVNADKAAGTLSRRVLSNAQSRIPLTDAINDIDKIAAKYGGAFNDDIISQVKFADDLDKVFGASADTSFLGDIQKAVNNQSATGKAKGVVSGVYKKIMSPDEMEAFNHLENMLRYQQ